MRAGRLGSAGSAMKSDSFGPLVECTMTFVEDFGVSIRVPIVIFIPSCIHSSVYMFTSPRAPVLMLKLVLELR